MAIKTIPINPTPPKAKAPRKATKKPTEAVVEAAPVQTAANEPEATGEAPKADGRKRSGFASMTLDQHRQASAKGGTNQPKEQRYFARNPEGARTAAKRGGTISRKGNKNAEI
jgi:general stress protein YciG